MTAKECYRDMCAAKEVRDSINRILSNVKVNDVAAFGDTAGVNNLRQYLERASSLLMSYEMLMDSLLSKTEVKL